MIKTLVTFLILSATPCFADWSSNDLEEIPLMYIPDLEFQSLKHRVQMQEDTWCSPEKAGLLMDVIYLTRPQVCVEIGAYVGYTVLPIASTLKFLGEGHLYAIDAWSNEEAVKYISVEDPNHTWWSNVDMRRIRKEFNDLRKHWSLDPYCTVIPAPSEYAIYMIPEIDFLHLDGNISEEGSWLDLQLFFPKVKSGGYILLSNTFVVVNEKLSKMSSMWKLFDECELMCEIDNSNTLLFRKN